MNVLVTGGAGFIGSHIVEELLIKTNAKIIVIDDLSFGNIKNLPQNNRVQLVKDSITNSNLLKDIIKSGIDYIFHMAAIASVPQTINNPLKAHQVNFESLLNIMDYSIIYNVKKLIFPSSAAIYGDNKNLPLKETETPRPLSPYGIDKLSSELYLQFYGNYHNLNYTIFRLFNVYGERQSNLSSYSGVISIFISQISKYQKNPNIKINVYGDGKQTRDFVYVKDVAEILVKSLFNKNTDKKIINLGTGKSISINQIINILKQHFHYFPDIEYLLEREGDIKHSLADISLLRSLGFEPKTNFEEGLKKLIDYNKLTQTSVSNL